MGPLISFACIKALKFPPKPYKWSMDLNWRSHKLNSCNASDFWVSLKFNNLTAPNWKDLAWISLLVLMQISKLPPPISITAEFIFFDLLPSQLLKGIGTQLLFMGSQYLCFSSLKENKIPNASAMYNLIMRLTAAISISVSSNYLIKLN